MSVKSYIIERLKAGPVDRVAELEAENAALRAHITALRSRITTLELLLVSSVGVVLAPSPNREVAELHVDDIRRALSVPNEVRA